MVRKLRLNLIRFSATWPCSSLQQRSNIFVLII